MRIIESSFRKLYQEYLKFGLTVHDFYANQDFAVSTFYRWQKILREKEDPQEFVPLLMEQQPIANSVTHLTVPEGHNRSMTEENILEFTFPNGTRLQLKGHIDPVLLKTLVHLYLL